MAINMEKWSIYLQHRMLETKKCWSDVPPELLSLILSKLFLRDRFNFKLVCKSWNLICPVPPLLPPPMNSPNFDSPILMFSQRSNNSWKFFHSLYNEFYYLDFPELVDAEIQFSKYGWLLMSQDEFTLFFFNPFTRVKIELPSTTSSFYSICFTSPPTSLDCHVFGIFSTSCSAQIDFGHIKIGDMEWEMDWLDNEDEADDFWISNCPPLFCNGIYYCLDFKHRNIMVFDLLKDKYKLIKCGKCPQINGNEDSDDEENEKRDKNEEKEEEKEDEEEEEDDEDGEEEEEDEEKEEDEKDDDEDEKEEEEEDEEDEEEKTHESYMIEVEGEIWGVFVTNDERRVSVEKLDLCKERWKKLESLGDKCLYVSPMGSFAETSVVDGLANKIYFNKFHGKSGVVYSLTSRMYYSIVSDFASEEAYGLAEVDLGAWVKPTID